MKKHFRLTVLTALLCLTVLSALSCTEVFAAAAPLPPKNTARRHIICETLSEQAQAYYTGSYSYDALCALSGAEDHSTGYLAMQDNELFNALHTLMTNTHTYYTSYSNATPGTLAYYWASTDAAEGTDSYVMFYADVPSGEAYTMNREHIWPKSRASFNTKGGGADLHHLRPSVKSVNAAKSDHLFGDIIGTVSEGFTQGTVDDKIVYYVCKDRDMFECRDDVKGDVARILLYVYCRWEQPNLYTDMSENLPAPDSDDKSNSGKRVIESLDTLLEWCREDPVDTWEMTRNDLTQQVQGNRNVFIDYPELAWKLFGEAVPEDMPTPDRGSKPAERLCGDVDGDGKVDIFDASSIQKSIAGASGYVNYGVTAHDSTEFLVADTDGSGGVDIFDVSMIQKWIAGDKTALNSRVGKSIN